MRLPIVFSAAFALALLAAPLAASARDHVADIKANPAAYDGKTVDLYGRIVKVTPATASTGGERGGTFTYNALYFCDAPSVCLVAITPDAPKVDVTKPVHLTGTYWVNNKVGYFLFLDRVQVKALENFVAPDAAASPAPGPT